MNEAKPFVWYKPRSWSISARLTILSLSIVVIVSLMILIPIRQVVTATIGEQLGHTFEAQSQDVGHGVASFLLQRTGQVQVLAWSDVVVDSVLVRNEMYEGMGEGEAEAEIKRLNEMWMAGDFNDPVLQEVVTVTDVSDATHAMVEFSEQFPIHVEVFITDRYGGTVASSSPDLSDYEQGDEEWWQVAWNGGEGAVYISSPQIETSSQTFAVLVAVPIYAHDSNEVVGVLRSTIDIVELLELIGEVRVGETGHAVLLDGSGEVLFDPSTDDGLLTHAGEAENEGHGHDHDEEDLESDNDDDGDAGDTAELPISVRQGFTEVESGWELATDGDGDIALFGFAHVSGDIGHGAAEHGYFNEALAIAAVERLDWTVVVRQEGRESFRFMQQVIWVGGTAMMVALVVAGVVSVVVSRRITRPLRALAVVAREIGDGKMDTPLLEPGSGEVGIVTANFNQMVLELREVLATLELRVAERTEELALTNEDLLKSNDELEHLAYITSHDLKAPLRAIGSLAGWMEEDLIEADAMIGELPNYMEMIHGRIARMEALLDSLLVYSRVGRLGTEFEDVMVDDLLEEVIADIEVPDGFTISVAEDMPTLKTKRNRLGQVFDALIRNGIEHHDEEEGEIRVEVAERGDFYAFTVIDDGPGIDPRFYDKIFVVFQTLQARDKKESVGLGLALVRRIVEQRGGEIDVISRVGEGSRFTFTWPKAERAE
ncbi:MAG TPA: ATP-binding protein [Anaerolineae bacterium]|nr:ATP-binding protein [Anaerolineae bacterium]